MKKVRFTEEQMCKIMREADKAPVTELPKWREFQRQGSGRMPEPPRVSEPDRCEDRNPVGGAASLQRGAAAFESRLPDTGGVQILEIGSQSWKAYFLKLSCSEEKSQIKSP